MMVSVAVGSREMAITKGGTLVTLEEVDPSVPIGKASALVGLRVHSLTPCPGRTSRSRSEWMSLSGKGRGASDH